MCIDSLSHEGTTLCCSLLNQRFYASYGLWWFYFWLKRDAPFEMKCLAFNLHNSGRFEGPVSLMISCVTSNLGGSTRVKLWFEWWVQVIQGAKLKINTRAKLKRGKESCCFHSESSKEFHLNQKEKKDAVATSVYELSQPINLPSPTLHALLEKSEDVLENLCTIRFCPVYTAQ